MKKSFLKLFTVALAGVAMAVSISGCETMNGMRYMQRR